MSAYYCDKCDQARDRDRHGFNDIDGEDVCDDCRDVMSERAYERWMQAFYGGEHITLREQQAEARKLK